MTEVDGILMEVETLITKVRPQDAEKSMRALLESMGAPELRVWEPDLRRTIDQFLPKRRRALTAVLEDLMNMPAPVEAETRSSRVEGDDHLLMSLVERLAGDLDDLSRHHIFQWSTFYRDYLSEFFNDFSSSSVGVEQFSVFERVRSVITVHAREIFTKGYLHVTRKESVNSAIIKAMAGLQRFLELPIEFYSTKLSADLGQSESLVLRPLTSAILAGILDGFAQVEFGSIRGSDLMSMSDNMRSWAHVLAFMSADHMGVQLRALTLETEMAGFGEIVLPVARAIDGLVAAAVDSTTSYVPLPLISQVSWPDRKYSVALRPPPFSPDRRMVEIECYFDPQYVTPAALNEATRRNVSLIVAPLTSELRDFVTGHKHLSEMVVPALEGPSGLDAMVQRITTVLESAIYRRRSARITSQPIQYNFIREFPLSNPFLARYYHVYRTSVRSLLNTFERRNGVRLWCSVRRSGKTTAGLDLGTTTGESIVITQTCDDTGQMPNGSVFYDLVCHALSEGAQLSRDFLSTAINHCSPQGTTQGRRTVFVLDEYETLFGHLAAAVEDSQRLRYTVVQPILNQLVSFTRENLIVFLGQQPTAHYILMDQNQLSAYVEQDAFPLFTNGDGDVEFAELLKRILSNRVHFDQSFVDRVFVETGGHPYLTVNLMVEFGEWLIRSKRPMNSLSFTHSDVSDFSARMLRRDRISVATDYSFFRDAIRQALSASGRARNPWLYAVYSVIRTIAQENPATFVCSRMEFTEIVERLGLDHLGIDAEYLLATGSQANFLKFNEKTVAPKIRLLARIAAVSTPEVRA